MHNLSTTQSLLDYGAKQLKKNGISNYKKEAEWLLLNIIKKDSSWILTNRSQALRDKEIDLFIDYIDCRSNHIPLQLIIGEATFYGRDFHISTEVFIPRPDSEIIVDVLKKKFFLQPLT